MIDASGGNANSERTAGGMAGRPGPLEVVAAQMTGHIQHLADEIQTRLMLRFEAA